MLLSFAATGCAQLVVRRSRTACIKNLTCAYQRSMTVCAAARLLNAQDAPMLTAVQKTNMMLMTLLD